MTSSSGKFTAERVERAIANRLNPIRGLTPTTLLSRLEAWRIGELRHLAQLWEEMEDRDWVLKNVISKRKRDAARCEWEILVEEDSPAAQAQKEFLEDFYSGLTVTHVLDLDQRGGVSLLLRQMMDAVGKRYAVHEIVWRPTPGRLTAELRFCPLWFFEGRTGRLRFLRQDYDWNGVPMEEDEWLVTVGEGLMLASSVAYVAKDLGFKDWLNVSEKFGLPIIDASTDAAPQSAEWNALVTAVNSAARDWVIVRNRAATISLLEMKTGGTLPQPPLVEYIDRALASLWRGADLSTISANSGAGQGASLQGDEAAAILDDDCGLLSETLWERLDKYAIGWRFGKDAQILAYFSVSPPKRQNVTQDLQIDEFLTRQRVPLGKADTLQRYSRPMPDDDEDVIGGSPPADSPGDDMRTDMEDRDQAQVANERRTAERQALRDAFAEDLQPLRERLQRILRIEDPGIMRSKLIAFRNELPALLKSINGDPAAAREFETIFAARLLDGLTSIPDERVMDPN